VVFFDNDLKFDVLRLVRVLRARIRSALEHKARASLQRDASFGDDDESASLSSRERTGAAGPVRKKPRRAKSDTRVHEEEEEEQESPSVEIPNLWTSREEDQLIQECLGRLTVFRCEDSLQFFASLQTADELIRNLRAQQRQREQQQAAQEEGRKKKSGEGAVNVLVIDSIGAFHNADRYTESGAYNYSGRSRMNKVVATLRQLVNTHNLIVFAGKGAPFGKLTQQSILNPAADPHQEYLGDAWESFVKYRLILVREDNQLGRRPSFWACIHKPNLSLSPPSSSAGGLGVQSRLRLFPFVLAQDGLHFHSDNMPSAASPQVEDG